MTFTLRRQLTLFVAEKDAAIIEQVRQTYNPIQFELIKSHVTLCRDEEMQDLEQVLLNLVNLLHPAIEIEFGKPARFDNGKGLFLPALPNNTVFETLRSKVLSGMAINPGKQEPHITLMHPRNSTCTNELFEQISQLNFPAKLKFNRISLIEQHQAGRWKTLNNFELKEME
ncbi:2'-5' RNA ligase family protein [Limnovirga soli]|uniref:2'-5' RNA ligase family protein n=1 Tax=Limnovirga soli TaxID=2656915 RepID=A0A8J8FCB0_9BACT|nr:2'-5' RNA ligase family protein [Limnovirga soli]NNV55378.1 2'-5' RNA ligase family protein [Limnovirga soli]